MAQIGKFGNVIKFTTSDKRVLNYNNFQRKISARWTTHDRIGKKPKAEFLGTDQGSITFTIELNALLGVKPWKVMHSIRKAIARGYVHPLVIGKHKVGTRKWYIREMTEAHDIVLSKGEIVHATLDITMEEY